MIVKDFENIKDHINSKSYSQCMWIVLQVPLSGQSNHTLYVMYWSYWANHHFSIYWFMAIFCWNDELCMLLWCVPLIGTGQCHKFHCLGFFTLGDSTYFLMSLKWLENHENMVFHGFMEKHENILEASPSDSGTPGKISKHIQIGLSSHSVSKMT